jgi:hypothetical protein
MRIRANNGRQKSHVHLVTRFICRFACFLAVVAASCGAWAADDDSSDYSDSGGLIIQAMPAFPDLNIIELSEVPVETSNDFTYVLNNNNSYSSGVIVSSAGTFSSSLTLSSTMVYSGTTIIGNGLVDPVASLTPPAANWALGSGAMTMVASGATLQIDNTVLNIPPASLGGSGTISANASSIWLPGNTSQWGYTGELTFNGSGTLSLSKFGAGTFTLIGANSGGQNDGTVPEPATALVIFIASVALTLQRSRWFQQS